MKRVILFAAFLTVMAACSSGGASPTTDTQQPPPATTVIADQGTGTTTDGAETTDAVTSTVIAADAPDAPDFVFTLGDGTEYHLGSDDKPVYLIFWAEW